MSVLLCLSDQKVSWLCQWSHVLVHFWTPASMTDVVQTCAEIKDHLLSDWSSLCRRSLLLMSAVSLATTQTNELLYCLCQTWNQVRGMLLILFSINSVGTFNLSAVSDCQYRILLSCAEEHLVQIPWCRYCGAFTVCPIVLKRQDSFFFYVFWPHQHNILVITIPTS